MKHVVYRVVAGVALVVGFAGPAAADSKCSSVNIEVTNQYHDPVTGAKVDIRVVDFQDRDAEDNKWRSEVTDNKRINFGQTAVWNKNLEYVGGETGVKIKVSFKDHQAGGGFSTDYTQLSSASNVSTGQRCRSPSSEHRHNRGEASGSEHRSLFARPLDVLSKPYPLLGRHPVQPTGRRVLEQPQRTVGGHFHISEYASRRSTVRPESHRRSRRRLRGSTSSSQCR